MKQEIEKQLRALLTSLTNGSPTEIKNSKKEIERLWYKENKAFQKNAPIIFEYLPKFDQIEKVENQAAFASGLSLFFLALGDEYFDKLVDFTLKVIQHPNGHVRQAIRNTADWLYVSLTERVEPFLYPKGKQLTEVQKAERTKAQYQYINLVKAIELLIEQYDDESMEVLYIHEMKPSVNKSLQFFLSRFTESSMYRRILEKTRILPLEIARQKTEVEMKLVEMFKKTKSDFSLEQIKEIIFNEDGQECLTEIIAMFDTGRSMLELENIFETVNDAWNCFPHKILGGLSPAEKVLEYKHLQQRRQNLPN